MATPHVSGLASLLKGFNTNLANDDIEQIIRLTADDRGAIGFDNQFGTGRINAQRALQSLQAPNQLFQWNATGGTVFSTSGNETKIFLGVPGFADAAYVVKRSEVRTNVTFPAAMCTMLGAWGRGVGTTGYREEQGRCFGEGICEVIPGTLTNTGATLRTWIYEVWGVNGQYYGFYPRAVNSVVFQYSVLGVPAPNNISGDDAICGTSNNYIIPNLPVGATVAWSASPAGIVTINSPNATQTTLTKNNDGVITLTATISNVCGGTITIGKQNIGIGIPMIYNSYYVTNEGSSTLNEWTGGPGNENEFCYHGIPTDVVTNMNIQNGGAEWEKIYPSGFGGIVWSQDGDNLVMAFKSKTTQPIFRLTVTNACGAVTKDYKFVPVDCGEMFIVSPNPATSNVTVSTVEDKQLAAPKDFASDKSFSEIKVFDLQGNLKKQQRFNKAKQATINISALPLGMYVIEISNGKYKERHQLSVQK